MNRPQRIVFVGGGYATLHAYRVLARRRRRQLRQGELEITVLSADDHHSFHGFTGEVLAGTLPLGVTRTSLRDAMPRATVIPAVVTGVDRQRRVVVYVPVGAGSAGAVESLRYDELVVATGGREPVDDVPGMREHGFTLRRPGELGRLLCRLGVLEHPAAAREPSDVVVVGGGFAGVELAAALAGRPTAVHDRRIHLVHSGPGLLPQLRGTQPGLVRSAEQELERLGVVVHCGVRVVSVRRRQVSLSDGRILPASVVLSTTGQRAARLPGLEALPSDELGRLLTSGDLAVAPGIWAAGDAARVDHPRTQVPVPANALWAIKAGDHLGRNSLAEWPVLGRCRSGTSGLARRPPLGWAAVWLSCTGCPSPVGSRGWSGSPSSSGSCRRAPTPSRPSPSSWRAVRPCRRRPGSPPVPRRRPLRRGTRRCRRRSRAAPPDTWWSRPQRSVSRRNRCTTR